MSCRIFYVNYLFDSITSQLRMTRIRNFVSYHYFAHLIFVYLDVLMQRYMYRLTFKFSTYFNISHCGTRPKEHLQSMLNSI